MNRIFRLVSDLVRRARDAGADFVLTPENTGLIEPIGKLRREKARDEANHPVLGGTARGRTRDWGVAADRFSGRGHFA